MTELGFRFDVILSRWRPWCHFTSGTYAPAFCQFL